MTKHPAAPRLTPKHMALARRERIVSRILLVGFGVVLASVVLLVAYGIVEQQVLLPRRPAATVNGDPISRDELGARTALAQADLLQQRRSAEQMLAFFTDNPEVQQSIQQQIDQINAQMANPNYMAAQTLQALIQGRLIRQEAERRGIVVSEADVETAIQQAFGYYAGGTPTPAAVPTSDPTLVAQLTSDASRRPTPTVAATGAGATATATAAPATPAGTATLGPTVTPRPTATAYTLDLFEADWQQYLDDVQSNLGVGEGPVRDRFVDGLVQQQVRDSFRASVSRDEEEVWAKHILVADETVARLLLDRLEQGEDWDSIAAEASLDTTNKDQGGDLGWFARGAMVDAFETAAFAGDVGAIVGPVQTDFGWHLIWIVDHQMRRLDEATYESAVDAAFSNWLAEAVAQADIVFDPALVPPTTVPTATEPAATTMPSVSATP